MPFDQDLSTGIALIHVNGLALDESFVVVFSETRGVTVIAGAIDGA